MTNRRGRIEESWVLKVATSGTFILVHDHEKRKSDKLNWLEVEVIREVGRSVNSNNRITEMGCRQCCLLLMRSIDAAMD